jgi:hypothetical protein
MQQPAVIPPPSKFMRAFGASEVPWTPEFDRILHLPRWDWQAVGDEWRLPLTDALKTPHGTFTLHAWQAALLVSCMEYGGGFAQAGVGEGKTLVTLLAPVVMKLLRPVLLVPASTRDKTLEQDIPLYREHFRMHPRLQVLSYEEISRGEGMKRLYYIQPDGIICDEMHRVARTSAARTRRFKRYFIDFPETKFIGMSGTITKRSLEDYRHLLLLALGAEYTPLPPYPEIEKWMGVLDEKPKAIVQAGALEALCATDAKGTPTESVSEAYRRRLGETPGVVLTREVLCDASLYLEGLRQPDVVMPPEAQEAYDDLVNSWVTPGGEVVMYAIELYQHLRELACGFYYKWVWPKDADGEEIVNVRWMEARSAWRMYVREILKHGGSYRVPMDSPEDVARAVREGRLVCQEYWDWLDVRDEYRVVNKAVWVSDFLVRDVLQRVGGKAPPTLIWVAHKSFGYALSKFGIPYFEGGVTYADIIKHAPGNRDRLPSTIALSIAAHGEGKNLQMWDSSLVVSPPSSGAVWEQLLGRTHRQGQKADEVWCQVYQHTDACEDAIERATDKARYVYNTTGAPQRLLLGTWV